MSGAMMTPEATAEAVVPALSRVEIRLENVPETLAGVPLPVSVVSEFGRVAWRSIVSGGRERQTVASVPPSEGRDAPEQFVVRTELPSGQYLDAVVGPPSADGSGQAVLNLRSLQSAAPAAASDFDSTPSRQSAETRNIARAVERLNSAVRVSPGFGVSMAQRAVGAASVRETTGSFDFDGADADGGAFSPPAPVPTSAPRPGAEAAAADAPRAQRGGNIVLLNYLRFPDTGTTPWRVQSSQSASAESGTGFDTLTVRRIGQGGLTSLPSAISSSLYRDSGPQWRPGLVRAQIFASGMSALIIWSPLQDVPVPAGGDALLLLPDVTPDVNPLAPPLTATATSGETSADALFSYIRGGALEIARQTGEALLQQAEGFLMGKYQNPIAATVGAYVLLKLSDLGRLDWISNLAHDFPYLADGAIIYAWFLIYTGRRDEAQEWLHIALTRGLPLYTEGIRLLRDGLNLLEGIDRDDAALREDAALARRLASLANLESELTCLRLEPYLILDEGPQTT